jgi:3-hydroxyacyl-[acyl-carrier-protein] dehydratase
MLSEDFYSISGLHAEGANITGAVSFNWEHDILTGHFPGRPVIPGACLVQLVREVLQKTSQQYLRLQKAADVRFLSAIQPGKDPVLLQIQAIPSGETMDVNATLSAAGVTCFKFKGAFTLATRQPA